MKILSFVFMICLVVVLVLFFYNKKFVADLESRCAPVGELDQEIHFKKIGSGPALVLIHGAAANLNDFLVGSLVERLSRHFTVYMVDRPGAGWSVPDSSHTGDFLQYQVDVLKGFLKRQKIKTAIVVGHSLGGAVAAGLAVQEPDVVKGFMSLAGAVVPVGTGKTWYTRLAVTPVVGEFFRYILVPLVGARMAPEIVKNNFAPNKATKNYVEKSCLGLLFEPRRFLYNAISLNQVVDFMARQKPKYKELKIPVSLIYGQDDDVIATHVHSSEFKKEAPQSHLHMMKKTGHLPHHVHQELVVSESLRLKSEAGL